MGRHSWPSYYIPSCQSVNFKGFPAYSAGLCGECGFIFCQTTSRREDKSLVRARSSGSSTLKTVVC